MRGGKERMMRWLFDRKNNSHYCTFMSEYVGTSEREYDKKYISEARKVKGTGRREKKEMPTDKFTCFAFGNRRFLRN